MNPPRIWTIGHSTRSLGTFISLLRHYRIEAIADVRRFPGSRRLPQFAAAQLETALAHEGIGYQWFEGLGGRRRATEASADSAWRNASFRGYAEHLQSEEFAHALGDLLALAEARATAMMCAEVLWWRCHRSMISDVLKLKGIEVLHIQDEQHLTRHPYTSPARLHGDVLSYGDKGMLLKGGTADQRR